MKMPLPKALPAVAAAMCALVVVAGCVSVAPNVTALPTGGPSAAPSLGVTTPAPVATTTPGATAVPTLVPASPTALPATPLPTAPPSNPASLGPSGLATPGASGEPGTRDLLFDDDLTDPQSGWEQLNEDFASITYDTGVLAFRYNQDQSWAYTVRHLDAANTTVLAVGDFAPQSDGIFGLLCGNNADEKLYGAVVDTSGALVFIETDNGTVTVLDRQDKLGLPVTVAASNPMALECSVDPEGALSMIAGLSNTGPVAVYRMDAGGPANFDVVGLYGEASSDNYTLTVDSALAYGVGGAEGATSDGAQALLGHIPADFQANCHESPQFSDAAEFIVSCVAQTSGKGAELYRYEQYRDAASMNGAYQDLVTAFGVESQGGNCAQGPNEATWSVDQQTGGRIQCAPQAVGIRFDWTDDLSAILGSLIDLGGSYKDTYDQWQGAGPV